jgi:membrane-bound ClpP family serine protease
VGGIIAFILGSFLLFPDNPYGRVRWEIILTATGLTTIFFGLVLVLVIKAQRSKVVMGVERFPGTFGVVQSRLNPTGVVHASGEQWSARSIEGVIEEGEDVEIVGFEGLTLNVKKTQRRNEPKP